MMLASGILVILVGWFLLFVAAKRMRSVVATYDLAKRMLVINKKISEELHVQMECLVEASDLLERLTADSNDAERARIYKRYAQVRGNFAESRSLILGLVRRQLREEITKCVVKP